MEKNNKKTWFSNDFKSAVKKDIFLLAESFAVSCLAVGAIVAVSVAIDGTNRLHQDYISDNAKVRSSNAKTDLSITHCP